MEVLGRTQRSELCMPRSGTFHGGEEPGCKNFESDEVVCTYEEPDFLVGNVDRYTIVIWMEGDDPECVDSIIGGSVQFSMRIDADYDDETNLVWKFVKDGKGRID